MPQHALEFDMTALFVLRHPQTTWNVAERYQGRLDSPLSDEGRAQMTLVVGSFAARELNAIVSSPLQRSLEMAQALAERTGAPLRVDQRLVEMGQGEWEGLHVSEIRDRYPEMYEQWYQTPDTLRFPSGEDLCAVRTRALSAFGDIYRLNPSGNVVVVTHSVLIQVLVATALCMELRHIHRLRILNAGITTLCGSEAPGTVLSLNMLEPLHGGPVAIATAHHCTDWKPRRIAS